VVRELEIIFGVDPVPGKLRIAREVAVLLQQLRRIAARTVVDPVAVLAVIPVVAVRATIVPARLRRPA
jgi:hypothetical protein